MRLLGILVAMLVLSLLVSLTGCSKDEDVEQLEQEMMAQEQQAGDTTPTPAITPADTLSDSARQAAMDAAAAVPEEEPAPSMPSRPAGEGFEVQVAGCEDPDYAGYLVEKYRDRGYEPYVTTATVDGQTYYRVRLGIFQSYAEAKRVRMEVEDKYSVVAWIDEAQ